ncbi:Protein Wnt-16, partial [Armadillidium nasatum]
SKETAFIYAVTSAGVVHAVTQACSSGNLTDCSCDMSKQGMTTPEGWKWGGCRYAEAIGDFLKDRYDNSIQAKGRDVSKKRRRRRSRWVKRFPASKDDLVHIHKSPNYCISNPKRGIIGTEGRYCNKTSNGPDSCDLLCCGRGYNTQVVRYVERCHCKFVWCCYVKCKTCITNVNVHTLQMNA